MMWFTKKNQNAAKENGKPANRREINMWWVISLMSVLIIGLLAFIYVNQILCSQSIMSYFAFASTLLSIVLSIFAIIYSYFSALEASRQWSEISNAVAVILSTTEHIDNNNNLLLQTVITIKGDVKAMGNHSNNKNSPEEFNDININNRAQEDRNAGAQEDRNAGAQEDRNGVTG